MWFRSDLRVSDNTALARLSEVAAASGSSPVVGLYVISPDEWKAHDLAPIRVDFALRTLSALQAKLKVLNIPLVVKTCAKQWDVPQLVADTALELGANRVFWNIEYEVNESKRDSMAKELLNKHGIETLEFHDQCVVPPGVVKIYKVFSPFKKRYRLLYKLIWWHSNLTFNHRSWYNAIHSDRQLIKLNVTLPSPTSSLPQELQTYVDENSAIPTTIPGFEIADPRHDIWSAGEDVAQARLVKFAESRIARYKPDRDVPSITGTSSLSPYLAIGAISPRQCVIKAIEKNGNKFDSGNEGVLVWISEICWRDFYRHILVGFPRVCKNKPFLVLTEKIPWSYDEDKFQRWCQGKTGYPIVDAGMRQLNQTGWMHNRLRMVTAMFLTKDLLIDWRWGEKYFMNHLIDGDLASNNGGWQWAASTGTDSQPYFRVFNPQLQSERFDPQGIFIKEYLPELKSLQTKTLHCPTSVLSKHQVEKLGYCEPMVNHKVAREKCIEVYKSVLKKKE